MDEPIFKGKISFVNYEKHFATIDYLHGTKRKSVNCKTNVSDNGRKPHYFRIGDEVSFQLKLSDRGDKMTAFNVRFQFNTSLELLIQKAAIENRFSGYLKITEDKYFVKEWDSYHFFPLQISPWEKPPVETAANEAITFRLLNVDKPAAMTAELFSHNYIPEYHQAMKYFQDGKIIDATVYKISPFAAYVNIIGDKIQGKITIPKPPNVELLEGAVVKVKITHMTSNRLVLEQITA